MAYEIPGRLVSFVAGADLSSNAQYRFVKMSADNTVVLCGNGDQMVGVLQNNPISGGAAAVMVDGLSKINGSGAIAAGTKVQADANGNAVASSGGAIGGLVVQDPTALNGIGTVNLDLMGTT